MSLLVLLLAWSLENGALAADGNSTTEPYSLRLVGGQSRCQGQLQVRRSGQNWTELAPNYVDRWFGARACAELDCGPVLSVNRKRVSDRNAARLMPQWCSDTSLIDCFDSHTSPYDTSLELNCSDSVRLLGGRNSCSGSVQIWDQSLDQSWAGVCEGALDRRGAEVLCRELGCGAPLLQGALSPLGQLFLCDGNESALMDCPRTGTRPETCSTLQLTCAEPLRLVGGASRCEGTVEMEHDGAWRQIWSSYSWDLGLASVLCRGLDCGVAVSTELRQGFNRSDKWTVCSDCLEKNAALRDCFCGGYLNAEGHLQLVCSELLNVPEVSVSEGVWAPRAEGSVWAPRAQEGDWAPRGEGGVWVQTGADFRIKCSVEPQYPGGSFQLLSPALNLTLPAVNHSAHFLFTDAGPAHRGNYTCVYLLQVFSHNFSSNSSLHVYPGESDSQFLVRALVLLLLQLLNFIPYFYYRQATRGHQRAQRARRHRARPEEDRTDVVFEQI